jgi:hypothetical protein
MKRTILIAMLATILLGSSTSDSGTWIFVAGTKLAILGSTNVNKFTCRFDYYNNDTLQYLRNHRTGKLSFSNNRMAIPVRSFDCGAKQISNDFRKTLKSETFPELAIAFRSLENPFKQNDCFIDGVIDITLAGVTTTYTVRYVVRLEKNTILLNGTHPVNFSDFGLEAPTKLQGLIRVDEVLNVEFNLVLKEV